MSRTRLAVAFQQFAGSFSVTKIGMLDQLLHQHKSHDQGTQRNGRREMKLLSKGIVIILFAFKKTFIIFACTCKALPFGAWVFVPTRKNPLKEFDTQMMSVDHEKTESKRFWARRMAALLVLIAD
jgi:hypothetical protein